jgi:hypothetical protein
VSKLLVIVALVLAVGGTAAQAAGPPAKISNCGKLVSKPANFVIACADANYELRGLKWTSWGGSTANGSGTAVVNDCTPTCVAGHFHNYKVSVTASRIIKCGTTSRRYSRLTIVFASTKPKGMSNPDVVTFTCKY